MKHILSPAKASPTNGHFPPQFLNFSADSLCDTELCFVLGVDDNTGLLLLVVSKETVARRLHQHPAAQLGLDQWEVQQTGEQLLSTYSQHLRHGLETRRGTCACYMSHACHLHVMCMSHACHVSHLLPLKGPSVPTVLKIF